MLGLVALVALAAAAAAAAALAAALGGGGAGRGPRGGALHLLHPQGALHLARLARRHGPVLRMRTGGRDVLVLSSTRTIREALVRHWGDWMDRPPSYLGSLVSRGGRDLALGVASADWLRQRGAVRAALARAGARLRPLLEQQARALCQELRSHGKSPLDPFEVFAFHTCSTIGHLIFGELVPPEAELRRFTRCLLELLTVWGKGSVRALDVLPALRVLPHPGLRELLHLVQQRDAFLEAQIRRHEECPSPPRDTVLGVLRGEQPGGQLCPSQIHMALVDLFIGGTETTAATLGWATAFLLHRPELQEQLHEELRRELGPAGTPHSSDAGRLPLLNATITETLRLRPPAPLALPHCARRHTSVGDIQVPAGSILMPNLLAAQRDPELWHHPEAFLPERFLETGAPWRALVPFGCGARACPGAALARAELAALLGRLLLELRLQPAGPPPPLGEGGGGGTVLRPPRFLLRAVPANPTPLSPPAAPPALAQP
ncbi:steroid 21-hydroxylase-like [Colius striatus]|uniref:steroid 21-hydroxylase-like n=1 Tax=Colius striatus TaxID=57412 RepID=UPI002B1D1050|nr:steroid 21-hydroxylase-like [Colius striatus]